MGRGARTVTVTSVPDMVDNDGRSVRVTHVAQGGGYKGVTAETEVTITDDDMAELDISDVDDSVTSIRGWHGHRHCYCVSHERANEHR